MQLSIQRVCPRILLSGKNAHVLIWANSTFDPEEDGIEIASFLKDQSVSGKGLIGLTDAKLKEMGLEKLMIRELLLEAIASLKETSA